MKKITLIVLLAVPLLSFNFSSKNYFKDKRDKVKYKTVKIGDQTWMAENLRFKVEDSWSYNNNKKNDEFYGRLYTLDAAKKACPPGWRIPTDDDWKKLEEFIGINKEIIDSIGGRGPIDHQYIDNDGSSGFDLRYAGYYDNELDSFNGLGKYAAFWTSSEEDGKVYERYFSVDDNKIHRYCSCDGNCGYSIRCIKVDE